MSYLSQPSLGKTHLYFITEEDLWRIPLADGEGSSEAIRLTAGLGPMAAPHVSPDGKWVALASEEEGHCEVYVLPSEGGELRRLTYIGAWSYPVAWLDAQTIIFKTNGKHAHGLQEFYKVSLQGGLVEDLRLGAGTHISFGPAQQVVLERNMNRADPSHWKRYRGGTMGQLWLADSLDSKFTRIQDSGGNLSCPHWGAERIFYLSDETGLGRIHSCDLRGKNQRIHAMDFQSEYYFRNLSTNGKEFVFQSAGDLYGFDPGTEKICKLEIHIPSSQVQKKRKSKMGKDQLEHFALSPRGDRVLIATRGKVFHFSHWSGPVVQVGREPAIRYKSPEWLSDGKRAVVVRDDGLEESLEIHAVDTLEITRVILCGELKDLGRIKELKVSPRKDHLALSNHRNELIWIDLLQNQATLIHQNQFHVMGDFDWSPDGRFLAFSKSLRANSSCIAVYSLDENSTHEVTAPLLEDLAPAFDREGNYLYFISRRAFSPIYDDIYFDMAFAKGRLPFLIVLSKEGKNPLVGDSNLPDGLLPTPAVPKVYSEVSSVIDFEGIQDRVLQFPVAEGQYTRIFGAGTKVLWSYAQPEAANQQLAPPSGDAVGKEFLDCFDFETGKFDFFGTGISDFKVRHECGIRVMKHGNALRLIKSTDKPDEVTAREAPSQKSGWIDLSRVNFMIEPREEWRQMYRDAWRMQKEFFWREDLLGINWDEVYRRYEPILEKVNCRREFSDLIWEVMGELGTSHAYEMGGDYRGVSAFPVGKLHSRSSLLF